MEFIHPPYIPGETITALGTPPGEGGIAIIRISGKNALTVASKVFSGPVFTYLTHTVHLGYLLNAKGEKIDQVLLCVMKGPKSYTGEDTIEIQCHGGAIVSKKVLEAVIEAGARIANPGEFTFKAFMNGKIDLAQAEAVGQLIGAKSESALESAEKHLEGALSKKIQSYQKKLINFTAQLEAWVDFPEEGLEFSSKEQFIFELNAILKEMIELENTYENRKKVHEGIDLCITGLPNAGKSSLMNALIGEERAIVTPIAGTTRDLLHESIFIEGIPIRVIDTAGVRETSEVIEKEGIKKARDAVEKADLVLFVLDATKKSFEQEEAFYSSLPHSKTLVVLNKIDLVKTLAKPPLKSNVAISAKTEQGLKALQEEIVKWVYSGVTKSKDEIVLSSLRQKTALQSAIEACKRAINGLENDISPEYLVADLRQALHELGTIIGLNVSEDILSSIFSQFCVGK